MDQNQSDIQSQLFKIFFPYLFKKTQEIKLNDQSKFVHYTSVEAAVSIFKNKEVWMRNVSTMNDRSEMIYGYERLKNVFAKHGQRFKENLDFLFPKTSIYNELVKKIDLWSPDIVQSTYLSCVSEHLARENTHGRLSMWRAYGKGTGVALVLNKNVFLSESRALNVFTSPVAYLDDQAFSNKFLEISDTIKSSEEFLRQFNEEVILQLLLSMCVFSVLCTKHPGFEEEREWRIISSPIVQQMVPANSVVGQERIKSDVVVIGGIPQIIYKVPLENIPEEGLVGLTIPEILDHIIIGPTAYPGAIADAFCRLLEVAGVPDPKSKIFTSDIPIR